MTDAASSNGVVPLKKVETGVRGLDKVLLGGIPRGRTTLIAGSTGTGKTVLGMHFLVHGAVQDEPGVLVTFEERAEAVRANAQAMGWDLGALENAGRLTIVQPELPSHAVVSGEFTIDGLLGIVNGHVRRLGARRLVIDALDVLLRLFKDEVGQQNQLMRLNRWLLDSGLTTILTVKSDGDDLGLHRYLAYLVDCSIRLDQSIAEQVTTRRLRVVKFRGSGFRGNQHPYIITEGGMELVPVTGMELPRLEPGAVLSSGIAALDAALDKGYRYGASVLISGSSGTGKTTLAATFAASARNNGERVLYVSFEESPEALMGAMKSTGLALDEAVEAGLLRIVSMMPEATGTEEHLIRILRQMDDFQPQHVIVDAISGTFRMGTEKAAFDFMLRLAHRCRERGITCIYTNQTPPSSAVEHVSGLGMSSLVDTVIVLEQVWIDGEHNRRLLVVKSRGKAHSNQFHAFAITDAGLQVEASAAEMKPSEEKTR